MIEGAPRLQYVPEKDGIEECVAYGKKSVKP